MDAPRPVAQADSRTAADACAHIKTQPRSTAPAAAVRALSTGSTGNSSLILFREGDRRRVFLVDLGLSPRAITGMLGSMGLSLGDVEDVFITHFDTDHFRPQWANRLPAATKVHIHAGHARLAAHAGLNRGVVESISPSTRIGGVSVSTMLADHDETGVAVYRFNHPGAGIGYATDVGRPTADLAGFLSGVGLLAIESNYCPRLQAASARPEFLKRRVMGGRGHLSNQESASVVAKTGASAVVLIHLSRQCNRPDLAAAAHNSHGAEVTVSAHDRPTEWVTISDGGRGNAVNTPAELLKKPVKSTLFG